MADDATSAEINEDEVRKMEKDIDDFLSSIREKVPQSNDPQSEATVSAVFDECDSISSGDFNQEAEPITVSPESASQASSSKKNAHKRQQGNQKNHEGPKERKNRRGKTWRRTVTISGDEHNQPTKQSSRGRGSHCTKRSISLREEDEYSDTLSPRGSDEFDKERHFSSRERASFSRERDEYNDNDVSLSSGESQDYQGEGSNSRKYTFKRRKFSPEPREDHDEKSYSYNFNPDRIPRSRHWETEMMYHKIYEVEDPDTECEDEDEDYRYTGHQHHDPYLVHENDDQFTEENEDDRVSPAESWDVSSIVNACLQRVMSGNPEIAEKITEACMSFSNKSLDRTDDSDYDYEDDYGEGFVDESGRVSSRSWRGSRSPSYSESLSSCGGDSGARQHRNRYEGHSRRIVVERSRSRSREADSSRLKDSRHSSSYDRRSTSQTSSTKRSSRKHHQRYHKEDIIKTVAHSIKKLRKQCEEETDSIVRSALLALLGIHERECDVYLRKPDAHPDYGKNYREFLDKKTRSIINLGGDPNNFDFHCEWRKYWPGQLTSLFKESWDAKMQKCVQMLQKKGHVSVCLMRSSKKDATNPPSEQKEKTDKQGSEQKNTPKRQKESKKETSTEEQKGAAVVPKTQCKTRQEMNAEIMNILKLLNHLKHKFKDCEAAFDIFYEKVLSLQEKNSDLYVFLHGNLLLLQDIDDKLEETLEDKSLSLIQKVIIQETQGRFKRFLNQSKETKPHSMKDNDNTEGAMEVAEAHKELKTREKNSTKGKVPEICDSSTTVTDENSLCNKEQMHYIPCIITDLQPAVGTVHYKETNIGCDTVQTGRHNIRTLTQVSLDSHPKTGNAPNQLQDEAKPDGSFPIWPNRGVAAVCSSVVFPSRMQQSERVSTYKTDGVSVGKYSDVTPGVTPPPPGVTPPPPGVTPPPPGVTRPPPGVTPPPPGVTPPPPGVTPPPPGVTPPPPGVSPPPPGVSPPHETSTPRGVWPQYCDITQPPPQSHSSPPATNVKPVTQSVTSPCQSVTSSSCVTPSSDGATSLNIITSVPQCATKPPTSTTSTRVNVTVPSSSDASPPAGDIPSPNVTLHSPSVPSPSASNSHASHTDDVSQPHQVSDSCTSKHTSAAVKHSSIPSKSIDNKDIIPKSRTESVKHINKELLRNTIKDCFLSTTSASQVNMSVPDKSLTLDSNDEDSSITSVPSVSEDFLKMFVVKPEDKNEKAIKPSVSLISSVNTENYVKAAKKPIKITIPQFGKRKSIGSFNPVNDDQELL